MSFYIWGHAVAQLAEALCRKVTGAIPDGSLIFPSGHIMVLVSTQSLTEMSTRNTSWWGEGGEGVEL